MKSLIRKIAGAYFAIGGVLATILWLGYMWGLGWGAPEGMGFLDRVAIQMQLQPGILLGAAMRFVLWFPSFVLWWISPGSYSLGKWLAPGLYIEAMPVGN